MLTCIDKLYDLRAHSEPERLTEHTSNSETLS